MNPSGDQSAVSADAVPDELKGVGVDEHLNAQLPLDLAFVDDAGRDVNLRQYFSGKKPVVLQLGYYGCPMLCGLISQGLVNSLRNVTLDPGKDFEVVCVSIDPSEKPSMASAKKQSYVASYQRAGTDNGWHFLTGKQRAITALRRRWVLNTSGWRAPSSFRIRQR